MKNIQDIRLLQTPTLIELYILNKKKYPTLEYS